MPDLAVSRTKKPKIHKVRRDFMQLTMNIASVATGIEALEQLLVEKGLFKDGELMERVNKVAVEHWSKGENIPASED